MTVGSTGRCRGTRGFSVLEALVSLLLLGALLQICWGVAAAQRRSLLRLERRTELLDAERTVWWVLSSETAAGRAGRDWRVDVPDVLTLRAFRGRGVVCRPGLDEDGWMAVRYRGWRQPDPRKDSLLVLDAAGRWSARALAGRVADPEACPDGSDPTAERWLPEPPPAGAPVLARLFEPGSYHLEDASFRYRRGPGGRQPLTAPVLDRRGSGLEPASGGARVRFRGLPLRPPERATPPDTGWSRPLEGG